MKLKVKKHEEEMTTKLKNALKQAEDVAEKGIGGFGERDRIENESLRN